MTVTYVLIVYFCSDNHLKISLAGLEKGIDFTELLGKDRAQDRLPVSRFLRICTRTTREYKEALLMHTALYECRANLEKMTTFFKFVSYFSCFSEALTVYFVLCNLMYSIAEEVSGSCSKPTNQSAASKSHDSQLVEVEILLYRFSQPSAEVCLESSTCTCNAIIIFVGR